MENTTANQTAEVETIEEVKAKLEKAIKAEKKEIEYWSTFANSAECPESHKASALAIVDASKAAAKALMALLYEITISEI